VALPPLWRLERDEPAHLLVLLEHADEAAEAAGLNAGPGHRASIRE
jgi:hypothetical protein